MESSAKGILAVDQLRDYNIQGLERCFQEGIIVSFKAVKGSEAFKKMLKATKMG